MTVNGRKTSFSAGVKEELCANISPARHCQLAELSAIIGFCGRVDTETKMVSIQTENDGVVRKCFTLLKKAYNIGLCWEQMILFREPRGMALFIEYFQIREKKRRYSQV